MYKERLGFSLPNKTAWLFSFPRRVDDNYVVYVHGVHGNQRKRRRKLLTVKKKKKGQVNGTGIIHIPIYTQHIHCFSQLPTSKLDQLLEAGFVHSSCLIPPGQGAKWIRRAP